MARTRFDLPTPDEFTQPWWDAAAEGRLVIMPLRHLRRGALLPAPVLPPVRW